MSRHQFVSDTPPTDRPDPDTLRLARALKAAVAEGQRSAGQGPPDGRFREAQRVLATLLVEKPYLVEQMRRVEWLESHIAQRMRRKGRVRSDPELAGWQRELARLLPPPAPGSTDGDGPEDGED